LWTVDHKRINGNRSGGPTLQKKLRESLIETSEGPKARVNPNRPIEEDAWHKIL
jgi:hypothetical protein